MTRKATDLDEHTTNIAYHATDVEPNTLKIIRIKPRADRFDMKYEVYINFD